MYQVEAGAKFEYPDKFGDYDVKVKISKVQVFADELGGLDTWVTYNIETPHTKIERVASIPKFAEGLGYHRATQTFCPSIDKGD